MQTRRRQLPVLLGEARRWFDDALLAALKAQEAQPVSSTHPQLFSVLDDDGTTVSELARRMAVTRQTAHQAVHALVAAGLLEQVPHPTSQRQRLIRRTAEGRKAHARAEVILTELERTLSERIGSEAVAQRRSVPGTAVGPATRAAAHRAVTSGGPRPTPRSGATKAPGIRHRRPPGQTGVMDLRLDGWVD